MARTIDIPLPLRGMFSKAKSGQVSGLYAATMNNWRSDGVSLTIRPGVTWTVDTPDVLWRVPFEVGPYSAYIHIKATTCRYGGIIHSRSWSVQPSVAMISGSVIMADGLGKPVSFNGTAFTNQTFTTSTGANPEQFDGVLAHHDRLYFWKTGGDLEFYYGDVGAISGALERFPLSRLGSVTGRVAALVSMTLDAGHGMNDVLAVFTTTGQIVVYEGLDPSDAEDWRLTGRVQGAAPLGRNAFVQVGADIWMVSARGIVSVGESLRSSTLAFVSAMTVPIADQIATAAKEGGDWSVFLAADASFAAINRVYDGEATQWIYWLEGQAWTTADMQVKQYHNLAGVPEATGLDGKRGQVAQGETVTATLHTSWFASPFASILSITPVIVAGQPLTLKAWVLSDYNETTDDLREAEQTITMAPEEISGTRLVLNDEIATDASGSAFQIRLEVTATWAELIALKATVA